MDSATPGTTGTIAGSWQPDPWGRHQHRWHDGRSWTDSVADNGIATKDTSGAPPPPPTLPAPTLPAAVVPSLPQMHQAPAAMPGHQQLTFSPPRKRRKRRVGRALLVGVGGLVILMAAIVIANPTPDGESEIGATSDAGPASGTESNVVPLLLGADVTHRERPVDTAMFGDEWPLTAEAGTLVCEAVPAPVELHNVFFVDPAGTVYAVNGTARGTIDTHGWQDFESIWRDNPAGPGPKVDVTPLIRAGLDICEPAPVTNGPLPADLTDATAELVWLMATPEEQAAMCDGWLLAPDVARDSFVSAAEGNEAYWPAFEQILAENC